MNTLSRTLLIALAALVVSPAIRAEEENPLIKQVKAGVKDPSKTFTLVVVLQVKDGKEAEMEAAFKTAIAESRKEKGCIHYELNRDSEKANRYMMYERWKSVADLEAHLKTPYVKELVGKLGDFLEGTPQFHVATPAAE